MLFVLVLFNVCRGLVWLLVFLGAAEVPGWVVLVPTALAW